MERIAVISDIHGNLHALQAVLTRLDQLEVDEAICLGDIVGYGPHPVPCVDLVFRTCRLIVQGNHDEAAVNPRRAEEFNGPAREAILWTRDQLRPLHFSALNRLRPVIADDPRFLCVHDNPHPGPSGGSEYIYDQSVAAVAFRGVDRHVCLIGHTHIPMVFETNEQDHRREVVPNLVNAYLMRDQTVIELDPERRYICNPGSVGQPRDCDPRASFAIYDARNMTFTVHRVPYDIAAVQAAAAAAGLPDILADRLAIGA